MLELRNSCTDLYFSKLLICCFRKCGPWLYWSPPQEDWTEHRAAQSTMWAAWCSPFSTALYSELTSSTARYALVVIIEPEHPKQIYHLAASSNKTQEKVLT